MSQGGEARWLLVGNSRWHWAVDRQGQRRYWSEPPGALISTQPVRWAAVGEVPAGLDPGSRIKLPQVPLVEPPAWLGVDRALAGYQAWCLSGGPVLVADAGTAMSLTWIDAQGRFAGGRLMAGAALQLQSLHSGTLALPRLGGWTFDGADPFPQQTEAAMACGVLQGLAGALERAARQLRQQDPAVQLWLTGGDAAQLNPLLAQPWRLAPGLCLDGLARVAALS